MTAQWTGTIAGRDVIVEATDDGMAIKVRDDDAWGAWGLPVELVAVPVEVTC